MPKVISEVTEPATFPRPVDLDIRKRLRSVRVPDHDDETEEMSWSAEALCKDLPTAVAD